MSPSFLRPFQNFLVKIWLVIHAHNPIGNIIIGRIGLWSAYYYNMQSQTPVVILDDEEQEETPTSPSLLKAQLIYQQHFIQLITRQNHQLKTELEQLKTQFETEKNIFEFSKIKQEMLRISSFIQEAEESRQSQLRKSQQEKQLLKGQLDIYKQKYSQAVSANLRKTKTLDKNEALANKLELEVKSLKADNVKQIQTIQQLKINISRLEAEKRRQTQQNQHLSKELQSSHSKINRQEEQCNRLMNSLQQKIQEKDSLIDQLTANLDLVQKEAWAVRRKHAALKQANQDLCIICYERPSILLNESCGHLLCCLQCSAQLTQCPVCRTERSRFIRLWRV